MEIDIDEFKRRDDLKRRVKEATTVSALSEVLLEILDELEGLRSEDRATSDRFRQISRALNPEGW